MLPILAMAAAAASTTALVAKVAKATKNTIGYAAAGGAFAGAGAGFYYQEDINEIMGNLFTQPNHPLEASSAELDLKLDSKQQQTLALADSLHARLLEHHDALLSQSTEQQASLGMSLLDLSAATDQTTALTTALGNLFPALHSLSDEAARDVQTMRHTTTHLCEQMERSHHELHHTQAGFIDEEKRFSALLNSLTVTENTLARSRGMEQKIHRLSDLQQQTSSDLNHDELITENALLKQQIRDLQAMAADTRKLLLELSEENDTLKKSMPAHERQRHAPSITLFGHA